MPKLIMKYNSENEKKNKIIQDWLNYSCSTALLKYKLGLVDVFECVRVGAFE